MFVTDMRNFRRFIPSGSIDDLSITTELCSFNAAPVGNISIRLTGKSEFSEVTYNGTLLGSQNFSIIILINQNSDLNAEVILTLKADMNPLLKLMAENYITRFLEMMIEEMEKFRDWT
jgi:carbon monoxide dehydrogenase subunit G